MNNEEDIIEYINNYVSFDPNYVITPYGTVLSKPATKRNGTVPSKPATKRNFKNDGMNLPNFLRDK